jgi:hypothetical protein
LPDELYPPSLKHLEDTAKKIGIANLFVAHHLRSPADSAPFRQEAECRTRI